MAENKFEETIMAIKALHVEGQRVNTTNLASRLGVAVTAANCRLKVLEGKGALTRLYGKGPYGIVITDVTLASEDIPQTTPRQPRAVDAVEVPTNGYQRWDEHLQRVAQIERQREERRRALLAAERAPKRRTRDFWDAATVRALSGGTMAGGIGV